jgi:hypothetical protein
MRNISRDMGAEAINHLPIVFDTHMVERYTIRHHTLAFAAGLGEFGRPTDVLKQFSAHFGRWIDREFRGQLRKTRKVLSENLGGRQSLNQEWEKTVARIT